MVKIKEADLIKMENGKTELPVGLSRTKHGYRLHRTIAGKKYNFGSVQNSELALRLNGYIQVLVDDYRTELKTKQDVSDVLHNIVVENSAVDMLEITRQFEVLTQLIESQNVEIALLKRSADRTRLVIENSSTVDDRSFMNRLLNR